MTTVKPLLHGFYPRNEEVVAATRDYDRDRASWEAVDAAYEEQRETLRARQESHEFPHITGGQLDWPHYFHPFTALGVAAEGALTRFVDTNTFYRQPVLSDDEEVSGSVAVGGTATVAGPHYFFRAAEDLSADDAVEKLPQVYDDVLSRMDYNVLQYTEPLFAFHAQHDQYQGLGLSDEDYRVLDLYEEILDGEDAVIHFPHGDVFAADAGVVEDVFALPAAIGVDLYGRQGFEERRLDAVSAQDIAGEEVYLGVVNGENTATTGRRIVEQVETFVQEEACDTVYLGPNTQLSLLSAAAADQKLETLAAITDRVSPEAEV